jgi:hypothetical protein
MLSFSVSWVRLVGQPLWLYSLQKLSVNEKPMVAENEGFGRVRMSLTDI